MSDSDAIIVEHALPNQPVGVGIGRSGGGVVSEWLEPGSDGLPAYLERLKGGVAVFDPEGLLCYWNRKFIQGLGIPAKLACKGASFDMLCQPLLRRVNPGGEDAAAMLRNLRGGWSGVARPLAGGKAGLKNPVLRSIPLPDGGVVLCCFDPEELDRGEATDDFFTRAVSGVLVADEEQRILSVTPEFCQLSGYPAKNLCGRSVIALIDEASACRVGGIVLGLEDQAGWQGEFVGKGKGRRVFRSQVVVLRLEDRHLWLFSSAERGVPAEKEGAPLAHPDAARPYSDSLSE